MSEWNDIITTHGFEQILHNDTLQLVDEYEYILRYIGSTMTSDGRCIREIKKLYIEQAKYVFYEKYRRTSKNIDLKVIKRSIERAFAWSVLFYGSETRTIGKTKENIIILVFLCLKYDVIDER